MKYLAILSAAKSVTRPEIIKFASAASIGIVFVSVSNPRMARSVVARSAPTRIPSISVEKFAAACQVESIGHLWATSTPNVADGKCAESTFLLDSLINVDNYYFLHNGAGCNLLAALQFSRQLGGNCST